MKTRGSVCTNKNGVPTCKWEKHKERSFWASKRFDSQKAWNWGIFGLRKRSILAVLVVASVSSNTQKNSRTIFLSSCVRTVSFRRVQVQAGLAIIIIGATLISHPKKQFFQFWYLDRPWWSNRSNLNMSKMIFQKVTRTLLFDPRKTAKHPRQAHLKIPC